MRCVRQLILLKLQETTAIEEEENNKKTETEREIEIE